MGTMLCLRAKQDSNLLLKELKNELQERITTEAQKEHHSTLVSNQNLQNLLNKRLARKAVHSRTALPIDACEVPGQRVGLMPDFDLWDIGLNPAHRDELQTLSGYMKTAGEKFHPWLIVLNAQYRSGCYSN